MHITSDLDDALDRQRVGAAAFVLALRARGVSNVAVLRALETVPREIFAPRRFADLARSDVALPLACGQTMTAPGTVAQMLVAIDVRPGDTVLEIGTGSGYVTALMARLGGRVRSLELRPLLTESAGSRLAAAGFADDVDLHCADGLGQGNWVAAPGPGYDRIMLNGVVGKAPGGRAGTPSEIIDGTIPALLASLVAALAPGGRLVCGTADGVRPRLLTITRDTAGSIASTLGAPLRLTALVTPKRPRETEV